MMIKGFLAALQVPPLVVALGIAEVFFKFHSFTLEALAFLAVWYVLRRAYEPFERRARRWVGEQAAAA